MVKRSFDLFFSLVGLVLIFPLFLAITSMVKLSSPGPVFYAPLVAGKNWKKFRVLKFRTMVENAEKLGGPSTAFEDKRLTKIGKFLRRYKIDELPQLINVLKGEMSVVGPRPQVDEYTSRYTEEEKIILSVKPGLTDWATLKFITLDKILGNENVDEKYRTEIEPKKNALRIKYAKEHNFGIDMRIIFLTISKLLRIRKLWNTKD